MLELEKYPHLVNKISTITYDDESMTFELEIDSTYHDYLNEHIFDDKFYVPATFIMEIMMEAANLYFDTTNIEESSNSFWEIDELEILRALKREPGEKLSVTCKITHISQEDSIFACAVEIDSDRVNKKGVAVGRCKNAKSKVLLKPENARPVFDSEKLSPAQFEYHKVDSKMVYQDYYTGLGERFQTCTYDILLEKQRTKMLGFFNCKGNEKKCINQGNVEFLTSPLGNDACLQYAIFLSRLNNGFGELPVRCGKILFLRKPSDSEDIMIYSVINTIDEERTCYDIYAYDKEGVCVYFKDFVSQKTSFQNRMEASIIDRILSDSLEQSWKEVEERAYYEWKTSNLHSGL